jgi:hypothetical protein
VFIYFATDNSKIILRYLFIYYKFYFIFQEEVLPNPEQVGDCRSEGALVARPVANSGQLVAGKVDGARSDGSVHAAGQREQGPLFRDQS